MYQNSAGNFTSRFKRTGAVMLVQLQNFPNYFISDDGKVWSCIKSVFKELKSRRFSGYSMVTLCAKGKKSRVRVHRLVAEIFVPNPQQFREVNHKDGKKENNAADNLEWCTRQHNVMHSYQTQLRAVSEAQKERIAKIGRFQKGENHPTAKYTNDVIVHIRQLRKNGKTHKEISTHTGVSMTQISYILNGKSRKHDAP